MKNHPKTQSKVRLTNNFSSPMSPVVILLVFLSVAFIGLFVSILLPMLGITSISIPGGNKTPTSTINETSSWKTHLDSKNNFSFKYPQEYFNYVHTDTTNSIYLAPTEGKGETAGSPMSLTSNDVWLTISVATAKSGEKNIAKQLLTLDEPQPASVFKAIVVNSGKSVKIELSSFSKTTLAKYESMFDQILSTFKFAE